MENSKLNVYSETARILRMLDNTKNIPKTHGLLANIRNSINKDTAKNIDALAYVFQNLPEEFLGTKKDLNNYEKAIFTAIQMYALHQQSNVNSVLKLDYQNGDKRQNLGDALSTLRSPDSKSTDVRFNAMVTSSNFEELQNHLRQLIKILKAKSEVKVDYASLADDLYWFLLNKKDGVKIKWARSYYGFKKEQTEGEQ